MLGIQKKPPRTFSSRPLHQSEWISKYVVSYNVRIIIFQPIFPLKRWPFELVH